METKTDDDAPRHFGTILLDAMQMNMSMFDAFGQEFQKTLKQKPKEHKPTSMRTQSVRFRHKVIENEPHKKGSSKGQDQRQMNLKGFAGPLIERCTSQRDQK